MSFEFNDINPGDYEDVPPLAEEDVPPLAEEDDDEIPQQQQERYEFDIEQAVVEFIDEPSIRHDVYHESDSEGEEEATRRRDTVRRGNGCLYMKQVFFNGVAFKEAVLDYALKNCRNLEQFRYDKNQIGFHCVAENCKWRVWCSQSEKSDKFQITRFNDVHSCEPNGECGLVKVPVIARLFIHKFRDEPDYFLPAKIEALIMENWKISVTRPQYQATILKALRMIDKEYDEQFSRMRAYKAEIDRSNPGSKVRIAISFREQGQNSSSTPTLTRNAINSHSASSGLRCCSRS